MQSDSCPVARAVRRIRGLKFTDFLQVDDGRVNTADDCWRMSRAMSRWIRKFDRDYHRTSIQPAKFILRPL